MENRKKISLFLSFLLIFNLVFSSWTMLVNAEELTTTVVINNITLDKQSVKNGDKVTVTLDAKDEINGITNVGLTYKMPSGNFTDISLTEQDGKYVGYFSIGDYYEEGNWVLNCINIIDNKGKKTVVYNNSVNNETGLILQDLGGGGFSVTGTTSDTEAPVFNSIAVDKTTAAVGDKVKITVDASDNLSGIEKGSVEYKNTSGSKVIDLTLENGKLTGYYTLMDNDQVGSWQVNSVGFCDKSLKWTHVYSSELNDDGKGSELKDLSAGNFVVAEATKSGEVAESAETVVPGETIKPAEKAVQSEITDMDPPVFNSISVDKTLAAAGDTVTVTVNVSDYGSGLSSGHAYYRLPSGETIDCYLGVVNEKLVGTFSIGKYDEPGKWIVSYIDIYDYSGNCNEIYNSEIYSPDSGLTVMDLIAGDFEVTGTTLDKNPPTLSSITMDKTSAAAGDTVTLKVVAQDDISGINNVSVNYKLPSGEIMSTNSQKQFGYFKISLQIGQYDESGTYKLDSIFILDNAGNYAEIYNSEIYNDPELKLQDFSEYNIEVTGTTPDFEPPVLNGITVDKPSAAALDRVTITADISDDASGADYVCVYYLFPTGELNQIELKQQNGKYVGYMDIGQYYEQGIYKIDHIVLSDYSEKCIELYNSIVHPDYWDIKDLSTGDIEVTGTTPDHQGPDLSSITVDRKSCIAGDKIMASIDASDDLSGIYSIYAYYKNMSNDSYLDFEFKPADGKFVSQNTISVLDAPGDYKAYCIELLDKEGNSTVYYNSMLYTEEPEGILKDLSAGDFSIYNTREENTRPLFNSITTDETNAAAGDFVKIKVDAADNASAISYACVTYKLEDGNKIEVKLSYSGGYFVGWLNSSNCMGLAKAEFIELQDKAYNYSYYVDESAESDYSYYDEAIPVDLSGGDIIISPSTEDQDEPVFNSVVLDKKSAVLGDKVKITISANDAGSGLEKAVVSYASSNYQNKEIVLNPEGDSLIGYFYVDKYDDVSWSISSIEIYDSAMNMLYVDSADYDLSNGDLIVTGTTPDHTPPVIKGLFAESSSLEKGQNQKLYIDASDDISGIRRIKAGYKYAEYQEEDQYIYYGFEVVDFTYENGKYVASFNPADESNNANCTNFTLNYIEVIDNEGNSEVTSVGYEKDPVDFSKGDFYYSYDNSGNFAEVPVFKSVSIDNTSPAAGDVVTFTVEAQQTTYPIKYSSMKVTSPTGNDEIVNLELVNGKYIGELKIMDYFDSGVWKVNSITLADDYKDMLIIGNGFMNIPNNDLSIYGLLYINNYNSCLLDLSNCDFTVSGTSEDNKAAVLNNISVSKSKAEVGDRVKITVNVSDDLSGISTIYLDYSVNWYQSDTVFLSKVSETQYEGYLDFSYTYEDATCMIKSIVINDNNGNENYIFNSKNANMQYYECLPPPKSTFTRQDLSCCDVALYCGNELYDLNKDGEISILDIAAAAQSYDMKNSDTSWQNVMFNDVNGDNVINVYDLVILSKKCGA